MEDKIKSILDRYLASKQSLKNEIIELITLLKDESQTHERKEFVSFFQANQNDSTLITGPSTKMIMAILTELGFPQAMDSFDELFMEVLGVDKESHPLGFDSYHTLFDYNDFYDICGADGNIYAINFNLDNPTIIYIDHSAQECNEEHLEDLYSDHYGFWFDSDKGVYINPKGLLLDEIFDSEGEYNISSQYITDYLNTLPNKGYSYHTLVNYVITQMQPKYEELFHQQP